MVPIQMEVAEHVGVQKRSGFTSQDDRHQFFLTEQEFAHRTINKIYEDIII